MAKPRKSAVEEQGPRLAKCACGHTGNRGESEHAARFAPGHGACSVVGCNCRQFTWASYVDLAPAVAS